MYCYKIEYTYMVGTNRKREHDIFVGFNCQEAVDSCRTINSDLKELRIERVWKECLMSWMAVNAWK